MSREAIDGDKKSSASAKKGATQTKKKPAKDGYSLSELFFLVTNANELNVYAAPHKERMQTWSELHRRHREEGYDRPLNSLRRKLEELVHYHMVSLFIIFCSIL